MTPLNLSSRDGSAFLTGSCPDEQKTVPHSAAKTKKQISFEAWAKSKDAERQARQRLEEEKEVNT